MLFKSPVFSQASGSIAGIVYSRNAGGMYTRARAMPTNPNTAAQQEVRAAMTAGVNIWTSVLDDSQRELWNTYAFNTPTLNRLGEPTHKTGQQMFLRWYVSRIQAGLPFNTNAPTVFNLGDFTNITVSASSGAANTFSITFTNTDEWANEDDSAMLVYQSRPQNPTRNFGKGPYQLATAILGDAGTPPTSPVVVNSLFDIAAGQKVFLQIRVNRNDGRLSGVQRPSFIVEA